MYDFNYFFSLALNAGLACSFVCIMILWHCLLLHCAIIQFIITDSVKKYYFHYLKKALLWVQFS